VNPIRVDEPGIAILEGKVTSERDRISAISSGAGSFVVTGSMPSRRTSTSVIKVSMGVVIRRSFSFTTVLQMAVMVL
jgi:hypothetical protein